MNSSSLARRFVTIMVAGALTLTVIAAALSYHLARQRTETDVRATLDGVMTAIEGTLAVGVYADDKVLLKELVQGMIRHSHIDAAQVLNADGATLFVATDDGRNQDPASLRFPAGGVFAEHDIHSFLDEADVIGRVMVHADAGYLRTAVRRQASLLGLVLVGLIAVLALLLNTMTMRLVVQPMSQLARQLAAMQPGGSGRLEVARTHSRDEIGTVVHAANRLLDANQAALARERAMREEISAMEVRYRQIFEYTSAGIFLLTPQFRLVNSNRAIAQLFGATDQDLARLREDDFFQTLFVDPAAAHELVASGDEVRAGVFG